MTGRRELIESEDFARRRELTRLQLLPPKHWPAGWSNPPELDWLADCENVDFSPWTICYGEWLVWLHEQIADKYPTRSVVPIANKGDVDDTACWEVGRSDIVIVHLGADPGREVRGAYPDFWTFFRVLLDDFVERGEDDSPFMRIDRGLPPLR